MKARGVGLSYRQAYQDDLEFIKEEVDFLEIVPELFKNDESELLKLSNMFEIFPHSLSLSVGTDYELSMEKILQYKKFLEITQSDCISDHLCLSNAGETELLDFIPTPFTEEAINIVGKKSDKIKKECDLPLILENITYLFEWPESEMNEITFITEILKHDNTYLLLDVTNLYINSYNLKYDPFQFIDKLPIEKIKYLHVSGCHKNKEILIDSHSQPINKEVWELLDYIKNKFPIEGVILERDINYSSYNDVKNDIDKLKEWFYA